MRTVRSLDKIIEYMNRLEISLQLEEFLYIQEDLILLRKAILRFNKSNKEEFLEYRFKSLSDEISFLESEAVLFLRKKHILL